MEQNEERITAEMVLRRADIGLAAGDIPGRTFHAAIVDGKGNREEVWGKITALNFSDRYPQALQSGLRLWVAPGAFLEGKEIAALAYIEETVGSTLSAFWIAMPRQVYGFLPGNIRISVGDFEIY